MTPVFLDTVGLLAVWNLDDQWHGAADGAFQQIVAKRCPVVTTTFVLIECGNAAARRLYREDVCDLRETLELRDEVIVPTEADWSNAWNAYRGREVGNAGIVDSVSFAVIRRLGLRQAFTNDHHFREAGFETLF